MRGRGTSTPSSAQPCANAATSTAGVGFEPTNDLDGHCRFSRCDLWTENGGDRSSMTGRVWLNRAICAPSATSAAHGHGHSHRNHLRPPSAASAAHGHGRSRRNQTDQLGGLPGQMAHLERLFLFRLLADLKSRLRNGYGGASAEVLRDPARLTGKPGAARAGRLRCGGGRPPSRDR